MLDPPVREVDRHLEVVGDAKLKFVPEVESVLAVVVVVVVPFRRHILLVFHFAGRMDVDGLEVSPHPLVSEPRSGHGEDSQDHQKTNEERK